MMATTLPATSPLTGPLWTIVVPALVFGVSLVATILLYRRFAGSSSRDSRRR